MNTEENGQNNLYLEGNTAITPVHHQEIPNRSPFQSEDKVEEGKSPTISTRPDSIAAATVKRFVAVKKGEIMEKKSVESSEQSRRIRDDESTVTPFGGPNKRRKISTHPSATSPFACITPPPNVDPSSPVDSQKANNGNTDPQPSSVQHGASSPAKSSGEVKTVHEGFEEGNVPTPQQMAAETSSQSDSGNSDQSATETDSATTSSNKRLKLSAKEEKENYPIPCISSPPSLDTSCTDETLSASEIADNSAQEIASLKSVARGSHEEQRCLDSRVSRCEGLDDGRLSVEIETAPPREFDRSEATPVLESPVDDRASQCVPGAEEKQPETLNTCESTPENASKHTFLIPDSMDDILKEHLEEDLPFVADRYDLSKLSVLGYGAYGCVYRATSLSDDHIVALKWVDMASEEDADFAEREINFLKRVKGLPHVVQFQGEFRAKHGCFIVMDQCDGGNLTELMRDTDSGCLDERVCPPILTDVFKALSMMHKADIIHRDIKPANVMSDGRNATLVDIGFCCGLEEPEYVLTAPVGSIAYGAPEVFDKSSPHYGKIYDTKVDMYSVGCTIYFMLNGADYDSKVPTEERYAGLSFWAKDLIQSLTHQNPARRLSADEAVLHPFLAENFLNALVVTLIRWAKEYCFRVVPYVAIGVVLLFSLLLAQ